MKKKIELKKFISIRYADPITSLELNDTFLCFGSMLGLCEYYIINSNKLVKLSDTQDEFISGIKIRKNNLYICIGDLKIMKYQLDPENTNQNSITEKDEINNYKEDQTHQSNCENCLTIFCNNYLIRNLITFPSKPDDEPIEKDVKFYIKNILHESEENDFVGNYQLSNYCVPFDFDGKNYVIIDFKEKHKRIFFVYDVILKEMKINIEIETIKENPIDHISHLKIIKNDMIFIVQKYNICQIRKFNLELVKTLNIKSSEILAFDMLYENQENLMEYSNERNVNESDIKSIVVLDIDCNIILYDYKEDKSEILFNLEKDELGIDNDIKDQRFFMFGYPYYIKISEKYIAITSDYGCILVQYNE
jgi:hypothetical protein